MTGLLISIVMLGQYPQLPPPPQAVVVYRPTIVDQPTVVYKPTIEYQTPQPVATGYVVFGTPAPQPVATGYVVLGAPAPVQGFILVPRRWRY